MRLVHSTFTLTASAAFVVAACSFGPSGDPPAMPSPAHYGAGPQPARTATAGGVAQQFDIGAEPVPQWWRLYRSEALDALVEEGLRSSPTLAATEKSLAAAHEQLRAQIGSSLLPTIDAAGQATRERYLGIPAAGPNTVTYDVFVGQIEAHYTFDLFGAVRYANAALGARIDQQAFQLEAARRALAANIVGAVINAATLNRQIAITERLVALANETANEDERRYTLGAAAHAQALASRQNAYAIAATLAGLRQQRATAVHALAVLIGRTPDAAPAVPDLASLALPEHLPVVIPSELLRTRPDIRAAEALVKETAAEVGAATAQLFPSLSLTASMGQAGFNWPAAVSGAGAIWSLGAGLSQPIFHGGALRAQRRAAIDSYDAAASEYKATVLSAFENVADTLAALEHNADALASLDAAARTARTASYEAAARRRVGALPPSAVRSSEQAYLSAQLDTVRARGVQFANTAALFQAMGGMPAQKNP
ncbi:NodT family efflux transporter outer membrane factor (OMF) lipoprotein [Trinickia symbiotica]|uniref:RND transporter n=1 Tax=Trinickia symbiotica TaxID=863227 RepID=A0A2N7WQY7_9BURK|nr:efflux transporter outer membrane subunit [Trinickia symbiotica]PMS31752.1 RND transporter [Trinickia symbiotica]PPK41880.1 NodT family efflux transporter outer membrane factor (OMF) lipoprotein [Trinickia symbiotica]